jgi:protein-disulfide isomerase
VRSIPIFLLVGLLVGVCWGKTDVAWVSLGQKDLEAQPLDIATSSDGKWAFILTQGAVLVYSILEERIVRSIPVDPGFERLDYSEKGQHLILVSPQRRSLLMLRVDAVYELRLEGLPFLGPKDAPVTLAVFSDYQCKYCARLEPVLERILRRYAGKVKLVIKNYPLKSHPYARKAATAALAADRQGKFWAFHRRLFSYQKELNDQKIQQIARELGLNLERFNRDMKDPAIQRIIDRDLRDGRAADISGTPSIFVNGKPMRSGGIQVLHEMIQEELGPSSS